MDDFNRRFDLNRAEAALNENPWFSDMLKLWAPPGWGPKLQDLKQEKLKPHLRLAIRDGYLNFYSNGQSIAKVSTPKGEQLRAEIHNKYIHDFRDVCQGPHSQTYVQLTGKAYSCKLGDPKTGPVAYNNESLESLISKAACYSGEEKKTVDQIVSWNPNIIDMEMGLPSQDGSRKAVRMDLVNLEQRSSDGKWQIVFWEVKMATDSRLRCKQGDPEVFEQLERYQNWIGPKNSDNQKRVADAYVAACECYVCISNLAKSFGINVGNLGPGIQEVAEEKLAPFIHVEPRLLIVGTSDEIEELEKRGHMGKIRDKGYIPKIFSQDDEMVLAS